VKKTKNPIDQTTERIRTEVDALIRSSRQDMIRHHLWNSGKRAPAKIAECVNLLVSRDLSDQLSSHTKNDVPKFAPKIIQPHQSSGPPSSTSVIHLFREPIHRPSSHVAISPISAASFLASRSICPSIRPICSLYIALEKFHSEDLSPDGAI